MFILRAGEVYLLQSQFVFPSCNEEEKKKKLVEDVRRRLKEQFTQN